VAGAVQKDGATELDITQLDLLLGPGLKCCGSYRTPCVDLGLCEVIGSVKLRKQEGDDDDVQRSTQLTRLDQQTERPLIFQPRDK